MLNSIWRRLKTWLFVSGKVKLGPRFHLGILSYVSSTGGLSIGQDVYIGKFCSIQCNGCIGNGVLISNNVGLVGRRDHDIRAIGVSIRRAPWIGDAPRIAADPRNKLIIQDDVWIGYGSVVLSGIVVGQGAVIAAGSVVNHDVKPYDIVSGNPAHCIGRRFTDSQIVEHESMLRNQ